MTNPNGIIFALTEIPSYNFSLSQKTMPTSLTNLDTTVEARILSRWWIIYTGIDQVTVFF